ncbi:MAG: hypothetical protein C0418_04550 [Coriobacteriaceae bacterium]|nr:hypothetical protein [Coriobacteriaceae bacterium]
MTAVRHTATVAAVTLGVVLLLGPLSAFAQDYDMGFTLPTAGKSGCMVCHGDQNLIRSRGSGFVSLWVDPVVLDASAHSTIMCTGCHTDFAYNAPHVKGTSTQDWRANAKLACKNCHRTQFAAVSRGAHSIAGAPGQSAPATRSAASTRSVSATGSATTTRTAAGTATASAETSPSNADTAEIPLCGDCHGAHAIQYCDVVSWSETSDTVRLEAAKRGRAALRRQGYEVCGRCHTAWWASYDDWYHGKAYKAGGAPDAPACWQCHGAHEILPSTNRRSTVNETGLSETCGQCHQHQVPNERYLSYVGAIHGRVEAQASNPIVEVVDAVGDLFRGFLEPIGALFG